MQKDTFKIYSDCLKNIDSIVKSMNAIPPCDSHATESLARILTGRLFRQLNEDDRTVLVQEIYNADRAVFEKISIGNLEICRNERLCMNEKNLSMDLKIKIQEKETILFEKKCETCDILKTLHEKKKALKNADCPSAVPDDELNESAYNENLEDYQEYIRECSDRTDTAEAAELMTTDVVSDETEGAQNDIAREEGTEEERTEQSGSAHEDGIPGSVCNDPVSSDVGQSLVMKLRSSREEKKTPESTDAADKEILPPDD